MAHDSRDPEAVTPSFADPELQRQYERKEGPFTQTAHELEYARNRRHELLGDMLQTVDRYLDDGEPGIDLRVRLRTLCGVLEALAIKDGALNELREYAIELQEKCL